MVSSNSAAIDVDALRRPDTVNANEFWYCSRSTWEGLGTQVANPFVSRNEQRSAEKDLCRIHDAGLIMESASGIDLLVPCEPCAIAGVRCRVWKDGWRDGCAFCVINGTKCTVAVTMELDQLKSNSKPREVAPSALKRPETSLPEPESMGTNHFRDFEVDFFGRPRDAKSTPPSSDVEPPMVQSAAPPTSPTIKTTTERSNAPTEVADKSPIAAALEHGPQGQHASQRQQSIFVEESKAEPATSVQSPRAAERRSSHARIGSSSSDEPLIARSRPRPQAGPRSESGYGSLQATSPLACTPPPKLPTSDSETSPAAKQVKFPYPEALGTTGNWWHLSREDYESMSDHRKARWTHIARMMTTDVGVVAGSPCQRCVNKAAAGWDEQCIVYSAEERERFGKNCVARCAPCLTANRTCGARLETDGQDDDEEEGSEFEGSKTPSPAIRPKTRGIVKPAARQQRHNGQVEQYAPLVIYSDDEDEWDGPSASNTGQPVTSTTKPNTRPGARKRSGSKAQKVQDQEHDDSEAIVAKPRAAAKKPSPISRKQPNSKAPIAQLTQAGSPPALDNDDEEDEELAVLRAEVLAEQAEMEVKAFQEQKALEAKAFAAKAEAKLARAMLEKNRKRKSYALYEPDT